MSSIKQDEMSSLINRSGSSISVGSSDHIEIRISSNIRKEEVQSLLDTTSNTPTIAWMDPLREVCICGAIFVAGWYGPKWVFIPYLIGGVRQRPIPYQILNNDTVILDFDHLNPLVTKDQVLVPCKFHVDYCNCIDCDFYFTNDNIKLSRPTDFYWNLAALDDYDGSVLAQTQTSTI